MAQYVTRQSCGHEKIWESRQRAPKLGDSTFCLRCNDSVTVDTAPGHIIALCADCGWRKVRMRAASIESNVIGHLTSKPSHRIALSDYNGNVYRARFHLQETLFDVPNTLAYDADLWETLDTPGKRPGR